MTSIAQRFVFMLILSLAGCAHRANLPPVRDTITEEPVQIRSGTISLAGTLVLPAGRGRHAAVVLFHGSGPERRNLMMAHWFADRGVASLTYDKRGVGESSGDFRVVPFMDLCDDGLSAIQYLKSRSDINTSHIGVWGLSQGGWLGPLAASRSSDVSFVIAVSGPGVSPGEQMVFYYANQLREQGVRDEDIQEANALRRRIWNYLGSGKGYQEAKVNLERDRSKPWFGKLKAQQPTVFDKVRPPSELRAANHGLNWFKQEMNYNPIPALRALRVPALFVFGDEDRLVPVSESVAVIGKVLTASQNRDFMIEVIKGADHGMQLMSGGTDPQYLETMRKWLEGHDLLPIRLAFAPALVASGKKSQRARE